MPTLERRQQEELLLRKILDNPDAMEHVEVQQTVAKISTDLYEQAWRVFNRHTSQTNIRDNNAFEDHITRRF